MRMVRQQQHLATELELRQMHPPLMQPWMMVKIAMMKSTTSSKPRSCQWRRMLMILLMQEVRRAISQRQKSLN